MSSAFDFGKTVYSAKGFSGVARVAGTAYNYSGLLPAAAIVAGGLSPTRS